MMYGYSRFGALCNSGTRGINWLVLSMMDDTYIGAPKSGTDGRGTTNQAVAVALIQRMTIAEINRVAREVVTAGSTIISDGHSSYKSLTDLDYQHVSQDFKRADPSPKIFLYPIPFQCFTHKLVLEIGVDNAFI